MSKRRSVWAVVAGFAATFVLSVAADVVLHLARVLPPLGEPTSDALLALATAYRAVFTVVGGYVTARLAPDRPLLHAWVLGAIGMAVATIGAVATWGTPVSVGHEWYPIAIVVMAVPCVLAGAKLRTRSAVRSQGAASS